MRYAAGITVILLSLEVLTFDAVGADDSLMTTIVTVSFVLLAWIIAMYLAADRSHEHE